MVQLGFRSGLGLGLLLYRLAGFNLLLDWVGCKYDELR